MCVSALSSFSCFFYYNGDKCVCVCVCASVPCKRPVSDCWVSVCEGRAKSWGSGRRNRGEAEDGVWRGTPEVFWGLVFFLKRSRGVWSKQSPREEAGGDRHHSRRGTRGRLTITCETLLTSHQLIYVHHQFKIPKHPLFFHVPRRSLAASPPNPSPPLLFMGAEVSFRPYVLAEACLQSRTHTHTHTDALIFMSLCSHCVHMLSLVLCCCSAAHKLALSPQPQRQDWSSHPPTPPHRAPPPINYRPPHTHTHTHNGTPESQSYYRWGPLIGPCVTLGPLCLIRCYNQTTKGLWHRDLLSTPHTLTEQDRCVCVCVRARMQRTERKSHQWEQ